MKRAALSMAKLMPQAVEKQQRGQQNVGGEEQKGPKVGESTVVFGAPHGAVTGEHVPERGQHLAFSRTTLATYIRARFHRTPAAATSVASLGISAAC